MVTELVTITTSVHGEVSACADFKHRDSAFCELCRGTTMEIDGTGIQATSLSRTRVLPPRPSEIGLLMLPMNVLVPI